MRRLLYTLLFCGLAMPGLAEIRAYQLNPVQSTVQFSFELNGTPGTGTMPIQSAAIGIDFQTLAKSTAVVVLNVSGARSTTPLAAAALRGPEVLNAAQFPHIRFESRHFSGGLRDGAEVVGDVTIRGVQRPLTLAAEVYRKRGSAPEDLSQLTVVLTGALTRSEFGADGFADLVADRVTLRIIAQLTEVTPN